MLMLLLQAKFCSFSWNWSKIVKHKFNKSVRRFFAKPLLQAVYFKSLNIVFTFKINQQKLHEKLNFIFKNVVCNTNYKIPIKYFSLIVCRPEIQQTMLFLPIQICPLVYADKSSTRKISVKVDSRFIFF